ncbi:hypothetical protein [Bradyrhizobium sp. CB3481]|uniref:hypothetical protein n=1 Tax=Bradyrhizobium sp. CB3481 TaxID=3039158 RepID=UPI0024B03C03|nr:hypothetical protein [Bradyrhizobium sp. CB3481]WFU18834.1 hypothetical protein QA643_11095 [Bradyrhizobium sp. CB3481]
MRDRVVNAGLNPEESSTRAASPWLNDRTLLALEAELTGLLEELASIRTGGVAAIGEAKGSEVEAILSRLYPVEDAIMTTPAHPVVGLGVKARHTAHVMSEYWDKSLDQIDWHAKAVRLLIEAVCDVAGVPNPAITLQD